MNKKITLDGVSKKFFTKREEFKKNNNFRLYNLFSIIIDDYPRKLFAVKDRNFKIVLRIIYAPLALIKNLPYLFTEMYYISNYNLTVTNKCSLNCKNCNALMPYYSNPKDIPYKELINEIEQLVKIVNNIGNIVLLGGEPFLYKDLDLIINNLAKRKQIKGIRIVTNGTILPSIKTLETISNKKVLVSISNYGEHAKNRDKLIESFKKFNVAFVVTPMDFWIDTGLPTFNSYNLEELKEMSNNCNERFSCLESIHGKIFPCPRIANQFELGIPTSEDEYVDIFKIISKEEFRMKIQALFSKTYLNACQYCGMGLPTCIKIPAAEQVSRDELKNFISNNRFWEKEDNNESSISIFRK